MIIFACPKSYPWLAMYDFTMSLLLHSQLVMLGLRSFCHLLPSARCWLKREQSKFGTTTGAGGRAGEDMASSRASGGLS